MILSHHCIYSICIATVPDYVSFEQRCQYRSTWARQRTVERAGRLVCIAKMKKRRRVEDEDDQEVIQIAFELGSVLGKSFDLKLKVRCTASDTMVR